MCVCGGGTGDACVVLVASRGSRLGPRVKGGGVCGAGMMATLSAHLFLVEADELEAERVDPVGALVVGALPLEPLLRGLEHTQGDINAALQFQGL